MREIRRTQEEFERRNLSPYAALSAETKGRLRPIVECQVRTAFQRDRDRIIHSKAFRRLKDKTQVFLAPKGDHYRTRLTHTLEVSQIARTIARALRLNEDLTEAIALGHDLGHTPFGHAGEAVLDRVNPDGFTHAEQSLRVVDLLENEGEGLNLTYETRNGILKHSKGRKSLVSEDMPETLEGQIVRFADVIAYVNHDIDDAIRAEVISESELPPQFVRVLGQTRNKRIDTMVKAVIGASLDRPIIAMEGTVLEATMGLREYLYEKVYTCPQVMNQIKKAEHVLEALFAYYLDHVEEIPQYIRRNAERDGPHRVVCDFIAGMTDGYALETYRRLFLPEPWGY
jgi:dGTPase